MARYTCSCIIAVPIERLRHLLTQVLEACSMDIIYDTEDYMMAREIPGGVSFPKLVTVEVLIDKTTATDSEIRMKFVIKNEELPLHNNNHCYQMFEIVKQAIMENRNWKLVENFSE